MYHFSIPIPWRSFLLALLLTLFSGSLFAQIPVLIVSPDSITAGRTTTLEIGAWDHYIQIDTVRGNQLVVFFQFDDPYVLKEHSDVFSQGPIHLLDGRGLNVDVTVPDTVDQGLYEVAVFFTDKTGEYSYSQGQSLYVMRRPAGDVVTQPTLSESSPGVTQENSGPVLIHFNLFHSAHATLTIFDPLGRQMFRQDNDLLNAGPHSLEWAHNQVSPGTYFYKLETEEADVFGKIAILP